jgi:hypothetical protein
MRRRLVVGATLRGKEIHSIDQWKPLPQQCLSRWAKLSHKAMECIIGSVVMFASVVGAVWVHHEHKNNRFMIYEGITILI